MITRQIKGFVRKGKAEVATMKFVIELAHFTSFSGTEIDI